MKKKNKRNKNKISNGKEEMSEDDNDDIIEIKGIRSSSENVRSSE